MNFNERLATWMKESNIRQVDIYNVGKGIFTKSYLSMVINGKREPNKELLNCLSEISQRSINWWLNGVDKYEYLSSLKSLIELYYDKGLIDKNGNPIDEQIKGTLYTMLDKELHVFANEKKLQNVAPVTQINTCISNDETCAMVAEEKEDYLMPIAAHDDDLTEDEKSEMDRRIEEYMKNRK